MAAAAAEAQTTIAKWTFESVGTIPAGTTVTGIVPEVGTGSGGGSHVSALTAWTTPVGNGSAKAFSANNWAIGDYWQFQVSTVGFTKIGLSYDQTSSSTGPRDFSLSYSTDGSTFTPFSSYIVLANSAPIGPWVSATNNPSFTVTADFSAVTALDNAATVYFRVTDTSTTSASGGTVGTGGTDRLDNFTVTSIPEPTTMALLGLGAAAMLLRRKN